MATPMNTDKTQDQKSERSTNYDDLLTRILKRRERIREKQGTLSDSANLIREDRDW